MQHRRRQQDSSPGARRTAADRDIPLLPFTIFNGIVAFFPLTTLLSANPDILMGTLTDEIQMLLGFFFALFALNQLVYALRGRARLHVLLYFGILLLFLWNPILQLIQNRASEGVAVYLAIVSVAFVAAAWATRSKEVTRILATMLVVFAAIPLGRIAYYTIVGVQLPGKSAEISVDSTLKMAALGQRPARLTPNVYVLIFDCMTSTDLFLEHIDSTSSSRQRVDGFHHAMDELGYTPFASSWSNYERTIPSMSSFFNFDYHAWDAYRWNLTYYGFRESEMLKYFKENGYRIIAKQTEIPCPKEFDDCYENANQLQLVSMLAASTPATYFIFNLDRSLFTPMNSNLLRRAAARLLTTKLQEPAQFIDYLEAKAISDRPEFTYAHFQASHPSNFYDENCDTESLNLFEQRSGEDRLADFSYTRYGAEYLCFLKQIVDVAAAIGRRDPDAWVLVASDHGYGAQRFGTRPDGPWDKRRLDAIFRILSLAKTSPRCTRELASQKSSVNRARALVNCLNEDVVLPYLPEQVDLRYLRVNRKLEIRPDGYEDSS